MNQNNSQLNNDSDQITMKNNQINSLQQGHIDFNKDFELRDMLDIQSDIEPNLQNTNNLSDIDIRKPNSTELENIVNNLPFINDSIRSNITLSIEIYKKLNNFDYNYIHGIIDGITRSK